MTIRTFARRRLQLGDLIDQGTLDTATARLLEAMVAAGIAIAVSGATGTGKTTLLNVVRRQLSVLRVAEAVCLAFTPRHGRSGPVHASQSTPRLVGAAPTADKASRVAS